MSEVTQAKNLVSVLAISASLSSANKKSEEVIVNPVLYIHYPAQFWKDKKVIRALIDFGSKVNAITLAYASKLGFQVQKTDIGAQKIDGSLLWTFGMVIAGFQVEDKLGKARFFQ